MEGRECAGRGPGRQTREYCPEQGADGFAGQGLARTPKTPRTAHGRASRKALAGEWKVLRVGELPINGALRPSELPANGKRFALNFCHVLGVLAARPPMKSLAGSPATGMWHSLRAAREPQVPIPRVRAGRKKIRRPLARGPRICYPCAVSRRAGLSQGARRPRASWGMKGKKE